MRLAHILVFAVCIGCGGSSSTSPGPTNATGDGSGATNATTKTDDAKPPTMPLTGAPEDFLALVEHLAKQVNGAGSNCKKYASTVKGWVDANSDRYKELREKLRGTKLPKAEEDQFDSRLAEAMSAVVSGASTCGEDDQAWAAFQAFDALIES
jgi:hypothetical protein